MHFFKLNRISDIEQGGIKTEGLFLNLHGITSLNREKM